MRPTTEKLSEDRQPPVRSAPPVPAPITMPRGDFHAYAGPAPPGGKLNRPLQGTRARPPRAKSSRQLCTRRSPTRHLTWAGSSSSVPKGGPYPQRPRARSSPDRTRRHVTRFPARVRRSLHRQSWSRLPHGRRLRPCNNLRKRRPVYQPAVLFSRGTGFVNWPDAGRRPVCSRACGRIGSQLADSVGVARGCRSHPHPRHPPATSTASGPASARTAHRDTTYLPGAPPPAAAAAHTPARTSGTISGSSRT